MAKKGKAKRRKSKTRRKTNKPKRRRSGVAKKRRSSRRRSITSGFGRITSNKFVRGAALGIGGGAIGVMIANRFAPQVSAIAGPIGALIFGGPIGAVAHVLLSGGLSSFGLGGPASNTQGGGL